jgi:hypothetical protein
VSTRDWACQTATAPMSTAETPLVCEAATLQTAPLRQQLSGWRTRLFEAVSFPVVLTLIVMTVIFALSRKGICDPDIWWHLHNADYLVQHHRLPNVDMYSFTVPGHAWTNHEWLAELPYYFAWRTLGLSGIHSVMFAVLIFIFLGVLYLSYCESGHYKASIVAISFSVFLGSVSFGPRTILFGYAYLVLLLIVLQRFRQKGHAPLWVIPPLFCLWVNSHGSWLLGLIIFSTVVGTGLIKGEWGFLAAEPWSRSQRNRLLLTWSASIAVLFVNPFGAHLVCYPFDLAFRQKLNIEHVAEWVSVDFHDMRGKVVIILLIILLVTALLRPRRWTLAEVGVVLFALYSGLTYIRFLFLLGIVVAPCLARTFDFVPRYRREMDTPVINTFAILLMISGMVHYWPREARLQVLVADQYPAQAISYLRTHPIEGPMLNFYLWGGYVNWRDPNVKIFLDSRVDIFEYSGVLKDYLDLLALNQAEPLLDKYRIHYVLFPPGEPLTYLLQHDPKWKVLYNDKISVLLERKSDDSAVQAAIVINSPSSAGELSPAEAKTP